MRCARRAVPRGVCITAARKGEGEEGEGEGVGEGEGEGEGEGHVTHTCQEGGAEAVAKGGRQRRRAAEYGGRRCEC